MRYRIVSSMEIYLKCVSSFLALKSVHQPPRPAVTMPWMLCHKQPSKGEELFKHRFRKLSIIHPRTSS